MNSLKINFGQKFILLVLVFSLPRTLLSDTTNAKNIQSDFSKTTLPILLQSCFACHGPKPQNIDNIQDPNLKKKAAKTIARAQKEFSMAGTFPFPESDDPKDDLKAISKSIRKGRMPPRTQKTLNLGQPLSVQDKKILLDWVSRTQKALN